MSEHSIKAEKINISFDGVKVLYDVDFHVKPGEVHALVGANGAGKSTLMKIINGVYQRDSGFISIFGEPVDYRTPEGALEAGIAMVFQDFSLIPSLTVAENIFLQTHPFRKGPFLDDRKAVDKAQDIMEFIGVAAEISPTHPVDKLTVGQQQIVEIAKALSHNPRILILDEPTASLSGSEIDRLFEVIYTLKEKEISIIYITHYLQDVFKICDSLSLIRDGKIEFRHNTDEISLQFLVNSMVGSESKSFAWNRRSTDRSGVPLLETRNITTRKIFDVSIKVYPGEIVGIAGLLGSGRTELLQGLFGIDPIQSGEILINGEVTVLASSSVAINNGISMVPENRREQGLILDFPVSENLVLPIIDRLRKNLVIDVERTNELVEHYIESFKVKANGPNQVVRFLSGGNQQKIVVAKCLASDSHILLLDDPTFGVDVHAKYEIMTIIEKYAAQGNSVLFVSSEFNEVADFCDSIYIMKKGRISDFITDHVTEDDLLYKVQ